MCVATCVTCLISSFTGSFPKLYGFISGDSGLLLVPACNCGPPTGKLFGCTNVGSHAPIYYDPSGPLTSGQTPAQTG